MATFTRERILEEFGYDTLNPGDTLTLKLIGGGTKAFPLAVVGDSYASTVSYLKGLDFTENPDGTFGTNSGAYYTATIAEEHCLPHPIVEDGEIVRFEIRHRLVRYAKSAA